MANPQHVIDGLVRKVLRAELAPQEGIEAMSAAIGGLTAVEFHEGKKFKLVNHCAKYSVDHSGIKRKEMQYLHALAALGYDLARSEGNMFPGEVHISKHASTKHHRAGVEEIIARYKTEEWN